MNTLRLYNLWGHQPLQIIAQQYPEIVADLSPNQRDQYNFWLTLPQSQRDYIINQSDRADSVIANVRLYPVESLTLAQLSPLLQSGQIINFKILNDEYMQFTDRTGRNFIVYGRHDPVTNQILPL